jgi:hypothetical protein
MHATVVDRLAMRKYARGIGDASLERACNADLARYGYRDDAPETTQADVLPERAVPPAPQRAGRPKLPRCEHNNIVGRCDACEEEESTDGED